LDEPVAFNRSVAAYNANHDVEPVPAEASERATHRESVILRIDRPNGEALGAVNWFGVHGSNIHADNRLIHSDNKGLAARRFEEALADEQGGDPVALFVQEAAGDVSPNYRPDPERGFAVGTSADDRKSASENANIQTRYALLAHRAAERETPLSPNLRCVVEHVDFSRAYVNGDRTRPPVLGLGMAAGTDEGPGPLHRLAPFLRALSRLSPFDAQLPWLSADRGAEGRFLGVLPMRFGFRIISKLEPRIAFVKAADDAGLVGDTPLLPSVLPLQLIWIGDLLIGAVPFEPTTVAGRRIRCALEEHGSCVVVTTYANDYAGYAATPEEYRTQHYEGSATYFGEHAVPALINALTWLARTGGAAPGAKVFGPEVELFDEANLIAQRTAGRRLMGTKTDDGGDHE
jgi:neutral ceramidase